MRGLIQILLMIFNDEEYSVLVMRFVYKKDLNKICSALNKTKKEIREIYSKALEKIDNYLDKNKLVNLLAKT